MEPPNFLQPKMLFKIHELLVRKRKIKQADFIIGIGDRAVEYYRRLNSGNVYMIPYAEDLSVHFAVNRKPLAADEQVTFLFSGRIEKRHNIQMIADVLLEMHKKYAGGFRFVLAGYGPEEGAFWKIVKRQPDLMKQIIVDRDYQTWEDRVRPFSYSDVLVYPSKHAGWGLVVPEAMAAGMVVISNRNVEAARYYIQSGQNGLLGEATAQNLLSQMEWCINEKKKVFEMGQHARITAQKGTAENVAKIFCEVMQQNL
jgi:glycosyltransferase involved in cell wall biosynthesis